MIHVNRNLVKKSRRSFFSIEALSFTKLKFSSNSCILHTHKITNDSEYQAVLQYKQKSALFVSPILEKKNEQIFPRLISPDLDTSSIFEVENILESPMYYNLRARRLHLNLLKLKDDYLRMKRLKMQIDMLLNEKQKVSININDLVKRKVNENVAKRIIMESNEVKCLIEAAHEIKARMASIEPSLLEIEEIVSIACLRLPNYLHVSSVIAGINGSNKIFNRANLRVDNMPIRKELVNDDENNLILYYLNRDQFEKVKSKFRLMTGAADWMSTGLIEPGKESVQSLSLEWSFVQTSSEHLGQTNNFYVGAFAKLEHAIANYVYAKLNKLNESNDKKTLNPLFENFKSMSLLKSAVVEACGQSHNDTSRTFNVVSFHNSDAEVLHLLGSSSLSSLVLNFVRTKIKSKYLPWTIYTHGRSYSPKHGQINCFETLSLFKENSSLLIEDNSLLESYKILDYETNLSEKDINLVHEMRGFLYLKNISTQLEEFIKNMSSDELKQSIAKETNVDNYFICLLKIFAYIYKDFNLPIRYAIVGASELLSYESLRVEIQAFLPSEQRFITV
jgi:hypothetical protein